MKFLKDFFERTEPYVQEGAKYHWFSLCMMGFLLFCLCLSTLQKPALTFMIIST